MGGNAGTVIISLVQDIAGCPSVVENTPTKQRAKLKRLAKKSARGVSDEEFEFMLTCIRDAKKGLTG